MIEQLAELLRHPMARNRFKVTDVAVDFDTINCVVDGEPVTLTVSAPASLIAPA